MGRQLNGVCATTSGACTLRAAITEGNKTPEDWSVEITTTAEGRITLPTDSNSMMETNQITARDHGAYLAVRRTMSIDLGNKLGLGAESGIHDPSLYGDLWVAGLYVNAPTVVLKNISNFFATDSSIVFGPDSDGSSLDGGQDNNNIQTENSHGNRFVVVTNDANDITISPGPTRST
jgi:hypothetical protein